MFPMLPTPADCVQIGRQVAKVAKVAFLKVAQSCEGLKKFY